VSAALSPAVSGDPRCTLRPASLHCAYRLSVSTTLQRDHFSNVPQPHSATISFHGESI
jgi:hypothetical protein